MSMQGFEPLVPVRLLHSTTTLTRKEKGYYCFREDARNESDADKFCWINWMLYFIKCRKLMFTEVDPSGFRR